jgi:hypothetical protein
MNPSSIDIMHMLEASGDSSGINVTFASTIFIGKEPSTPKNCVTIYDTPGGSPYLGLDCVGYEYPSVQVRVRNVKYLEGFRIINDIKDSLHGRAQETWNGTLYSVIYCQGSPAFLEWDDNGCAVFVCNFNIQRR